MKNMQQQSTEPLEPRFNGKDCKEDHVVMPVGTSSGRASNHFPPQAGAGINIKNTVDQQVEFDFGPYQGMR